MSLVTFLELPPDLYASECSNAMVKSLHIFVLLFQYLSQYKFNQVTMLLCTVLVPAAAIGSLCLMT